MCQTVASGYFRSFRVPALPLKMSSSRPAKLPDRSHLSGAVMATALAAARMPRVRCRGVKEDKKSSLLPGTQLPPEKLQQLEQHLDSQVQAGLDRAEGTKMKPYRVEMPQLPQWLLFCCMLPYVLPALDCWRFFGLALSQQLCPSLALEWTSFLQQTMLEDLQPVVEVLQPVLLFAMPAIAVRRSLPQLLRFNLNQAFLIDLGVCVAFHASCFSRWLSLQRGDQIYVPSDAELPVMPGSKAILLFCGISLLYCVCSTLLGAFPDAIPTISVEAKKSLGSRRSWRFRSRSQ
eukprot:Skav206855  [mRNA]  locus=scaffold1667:134624:149376:+ [translate_table: standard]